MKGSFILCVSFMCFFLTVSSVPLTMSFRVSCRVSLRVSLRFLEGGL